MTTAILDPTIGHVVGLALESGGVRVYLTGPVTGGYSHILPLGCDVALVLPDGSVKPLGDVAALPELLGGHDLDCRLWWDDSVTQNVVRALFITR